MTQGLQLSLLMTGTDIALAPDAALSDDAAQGQGIMFGQMLNEFSQPAKNGPTEAKLKLLPADVSELSVISQALLAATNTDVTIEVNETDNSTLLAASILEQIALKDSTITAVASKDGVQPQPSSGKNTNNAAAGEITSEALTVVDAQTKGVNPLANAALANSSENTATDASAQNAAKLPIAAHSNNAAGAEANVQVDAKLGGEKSTLKAANDSTARYKNTDIAKGGVATLMPAPKIDHAIPLPPETKITLESVEVDTEVTSEHIDIDIDKAAIDKYVAKVDLLKAEQNPKSSEIKGQVRVDAEDTIRKQTESISVAEQIVAKTDSQTDTLVSSDKPSLITVPINKIDISLVEQSKTESKVQQADSNKNSEQSLEKNNQIQTISNNQPQSLAGQNLNQNAKGRSETNAGRSEGTLNGQLSEKSNQIQANSNNQSQPLVDNNPNQNTRVSADVSAGRNESAFNSTLLAAEQHRHAGVDKAAAPSVAEQIKQNLNMLHQDAPEQLRERVNLMLRQNIQIAEIRLDPAGLGKMQIKIDMQQDQASVQFVVQQSHAKEVLEQHMPRLREMLQQQGIALNDSNVQQQTQQQQERQFEQRDSNSTTNQQGDELTGDVNQPDTVVQVATSISDRLVDYYA